MMNKKNIAIIGSASIGTTTIALELANRGHNVCVIDNYIKEPEPETFLIRNLPEFKEPFLLNKEPVFNYKKHIETCNKKRKDRKNKKKR